MATIIEPFYLELGRRLQGAREKAGLSQQDVANQLSPPVTRASIANIENGKQRVLCHTLMDLGRILDTPVANLMGATKRAAQGPVQARGRLGREHSVERVQW
jgi:transcriptional regulator with XRE-family HTH domain